MPFLTFAFCTYNRADRLTKLVDAMRSQTCPIPFEILAINNNSSDNTSETLNRLAQLDGPTVRWVTESSPGLVAARNRGISESLNSDIMVFIDDDEIPFPGLLESATHAILNEGAECAGGRVLLDFSTIARPRWLKDNLLGFLAATDYGKEAFWINDLSTPIWTANIAYDMRLFRNDSKLRFDKRYDRQGKGAGSGEDEIMFNTLVARNARIRYCPGMVVLHEVETSRLKRNYFIRLHFRAGLRRGQYVLPEYPRTISGIPPFLVAQLMRHGFRTVARLLTSKSGVIRQAMNVSFAWGMILGYRRRQRCSPTSE